MKEMAKASYTLHIPARARQVSLAAHHYLTSGPIRGINTASVLFGHPNDALHVVGDETPELDSHIKQTGALIGDVANLPVVPVTKQGKNVAHWSIANPNYQAGPQGPPAALAGPQSAPLPSAGPVPTPPG